MKKLLTAVILMALSAPAFAQMAPGPVAAPSADDARWTVKASAGYFPTVPVLVDLFGAIFVGIAVEANSSANEKLDISIPPYCTIEGLYHFNDRWALGGSAGYLGTVWKVVDKDTEAVHSKTYLTFIPLTVEGRYNYVSNPAFKFYGSIEAGALFADGDGFDVIPDFQINPIGLEFGRRFFGSIEFGAGVNYVGTRFGLGFRF